MSRRLTVRIDGRGRGFEQAVPVKHGRACKVASPDQHVPVEPYRRIGLLRHSPTTLHYLDSRPNLFLCSPPYHPITPSLVRADVSARGIRADLVSPRIPLFVRFVQEQRDAKDAGPGERGGEELRGSSASPRVSSQSRWDGVQFPTGV